MDETYPQDQGNFRPALRRPVMQYNIPEEKRERISKTTGWCMIGVAAFIDLLEILFTALAIGLVLNPIISVCADVGFWIWFKTHNVSFIKKPKNLAAMGIQGIIGLIPGLDVLPELTLAVFILVKMTQSEDKGGIIGKAANVVQSKA